MLQYNHQKIINLQAVNCFISNDYFLIQKRVEKSLKSDPYFLKINRKDSTIIQVTLADIWKSNQNIKKRVVNQFNNLADKYGYQKITPDIMQIVHVSQDKNSSQNPLKGYNKRSFSAFIGIITLQNCNFLVFIDQSKVVSSVDTIEIFQISSLFFMPFKDQNQMKKQANKFKIFQSIRQLSSILNYGFYFSFNHKLTRSLQYQLLEKDFSYVWNKRMLKPLKDFSKWQTPIIQGFVKSFQIIIQGCKMEYVLISRRSTDKGGPRYFDRGINEQGNVANFVQTQQIIKIKDYLISDVQIRGNVPIFFQQKGITTKVRITRGTQLTHQVFKKHIRMLIHYYLRIFIVNLLSKSKEDQNLIIEEFEKHVKAQQFPTEQNSNNNGMNTSVSLENQMKYFYCDFHQKVQGILFLNEGSNFENMDEPIKLVAQIKKNFRFYICQGNKVIQRPAGVFRTNCLDCLDRTNFFQAKIALVTLQQILQLFDIKFQKSLITIMNDRLDERPLIKNFRNIWADNGDNISFHYTGTESTHSDITRQGSRGWLGGFKHKYKSVTRFYNQNFFDFYKMKLVDMLLENQTKMVNQKKEAEIPDYMKMRQLQFCQKIKQQIYLWTWKVPKKAPPSLPFFPIDPKIIAIGLQEVQDIDPWKKLIQESINQQKYILVAQKISNKNYLVIYGHKTIKNEIKNVEQTKIKFKSYYNTYFSTKCAVLIRLTLYSTRIVFINVQLQYGRDSFQNRISNLKELHQYAFQEEQVGKKKSHSINQDDVVFLFGNTNCTIQSSNNKNYFEKLQACQKQQKNLLASKVQLGGLSQLKVPETMQKSYSSKLDKRSIIRKLLQTDDFQYLRQILLQYRYYDEQEIKFSPTYLKTNGKYDVQKSGWPDRIWISTQNQFQCLNYEIVSGLKKDKHQGVTATYRISCDKVDQKVRQAVFRDIAVSIVGVLDQDLQENIKQQQQNIAFKK